MSTLPRRVARAHELVELGRPDCCWRRVARAHQLVELTWPDRGSCSCLPLPLPALPRSSRRLGMGFVFFAAATANARRTLRQDLTHIDRQLLFDPLPVETTGAVAVVDVDVAARV